MGELWQLESAPHQKFFFSYVRSQQLLTIIIIWQIINNYHLNNHQQLSSQQLSTIIICNYLQQLHLSQIAFSCIISGRWRWQLQLLLRKASPQTSGQANFTKLRGCPLACVEVLLWDSLLNVQNLLNYLGDGIIAIIVLKDYLEEGNLSAERNWPTLKNASIGEPWDPASSLISENFCTFLSISH